MKRESIAYYRFAQRYLRQISKWFYKEYGFSLKLWQAMAFTIQTVDKLPVEIMESIGVRVQGRGRLPLKLAQANVVIPRRLVMRLNRTYNIYGSTVAPNKALFNTALIMYRAWTLKPPSKNTRPRINLLITHDDERKGGGRKSYRPLLTRIAGIHPPP